MLADTIDVYLHSGALFFIISANKMLLKKFCTNGYFTDPEDITRISRALSRGLINQELNAFKLYTVA